MSAGSNTGILQSRRTKIVQRSVWQLTSANDEFLNPGRNGDEVCIMVVPSNSTMCCGCLPCHPATQVSPAFAWLYSRSCWMFAAWDLTDPHPLASLPPPPLNNQVPSGPNIMWSKFGRNMGKLSPGMVVCWPIWNEVTAMVSKQVITYNAVPKSCPTKDMVMVDVDLSINLRIGPDQQRVEDFVFKMGPSRLDAYIEFEVEECIRALVNNVK